MLWIFIYTNRMDTYENKKIINIIKEKKLTDKIKILDPNDISVMLNKKTFYYYKGVKVSPPTKLWVKLGCMLDSYTKDIVNALAKEGIKLIDSLEELEVVSNKFATTIMLKSQNIPCIKSMKIPSNVYQNVKFIEENFQYPMIIKSKVGSLGRGIYKISTRPELENILDQINLLDDKYEMIVQEYIKEGNKDYRVVVHGGQIQYVMKREALENEFKTNINLGAKSTIVSPNEEVLKLVSRIYKVIPLNVMGIDLIKKGNEYIVCEINSNPGFIGFDRETEGFVNILLEYVINK